MILRPCDSFGGPCDLLCVQAHKLFVNSLMHAHIPATFYILPTDAIEEGERINGFWTVLMLQINLSVAIDPAVGVYSELDANGTQIDTPWPFDIEDYQRYALKCVQRFRLIRLSTIRCCYLQTFARTLPCAITSAKQMCRQIKTISR